MTVWNDRDFSRGNWQVRYSRNSGYPGWFIGVFDTTKDDFLNLFPLSRFTNDAFFRGASLGLTWPLTARETLGVSLEFKENEYEPAFFVASPVPADLTTTNHLYRILYRWDLREESADKEVNPYGNRLVELSWADSPGFFEGELRYREAILDWREYIRAGHNDRDVVALRLLGGVRNRRGGSAYPVEFTLGGDDTLRGVQDNALRGTRFAALSFEYRKRLFDRQMAEHAVGALRKSVLAPFFFFDTVYLALFADAGTASYDDLTIDRVEKGFGIELRAQSYLTKFRPIVLRMGFAHGTDDLGDDKFYLATGTVF